MICAKLHFISILCERFWTRHDTSIVDQNVETWFKLMKLFRKVLNWFKWRQVELQYENLCTFRTFSNFVQRFFTFSFVTTGNVDFSTTTRQINCCLFPDSSVCSSDDDNFVINPSIFGVNRFLNNVLAEMNLWMKFLCCSAFVVICSISQSLYYSIHFFWMFIQLWISLISQPRLLRRLPRLTPNFLKLKLKK